MKMAKVITLQVSINKRHDALIVTTVPPHVTVDSMLTPDGKKNLRHYEETAVMPLPFALALAAQKRKEKGL